jgi:hypothetical protein
MTRSIVLLGAALAMGAAGPAAAATATTATASFGCEARKSAVCYFRIFYHPRNNRQIVLPGGMKTSVPGVTIGSDRYCVSVGTPPRHRCASKPISAGYNS